METVFCVIVNENMNSYGARIERHQGSGQPAGMSGWERVWGFYNTQQEANDGKAGAEIYLQKMFGYRGDSYVC